MTRLQIGEVAHRCGVNLQTIRDYERRGLLPAPPRSAANYRLYPEDTPARVRFIRRAQRLGFTLREIDEPIYDPGCPHVAAVREAVREGAELGLAPSWTEWLRGAPRAWSRPNAGAAR